MSSDLFLKIAEPRDDHDRKMRYSYDNLTTRYWLEGHVPGLEQAMAFLLEKSVALFRARQDEKARETRDLADELKPLIEAARKRVMEHRTEFVESFESSLTAASSTETNS